MTFRDRHIYDDNGLCMFCRRTLHDVVMNMLECIDTPRPGIETPSSYRATTHIPSVLPLDVQELLSGELVLTREHYLRNTR